MQQQILKLCSQFNINYNLISYKFINNGHINTTIEVVFFDGEKNKRYILQKINKYVFKNPEDIMQNIANVTAFLKQKMKENGNGQKVLKFYNSIYGKPYVTDVNGEYWRLCKFIENSVTFNKTDDLNIIEETGKAFGNFQALLSDYPIETLNITIPDFHNVPNRYIVLQNAIVSDSYGRAKTVLQELDTIYKLQNQVCLLQSMQEQGKLKIRVTHNDTKCNNILFDFNTHKYKSVIDLDTVMPGLVAYDFGDAIRYIANTSNEDEQNLSKVKIDLNKYKAFTKGFLHKLADNLTSTEKNTLTLGALTITTECAIRFLTDYLEGDKYFKTDYPEHNLIRARCQLALANSMVKNYNKMQEIVKTCIKDYNKEKQ